jgi:hypothetical protein
VFVTVNHFHLSLIFGAKLEAYSLSDSCEELYLGRFTIMEVKCSSIKFNLLTESLILNRDRAIILTKKESCLCACDHVFKNIPLTREC